MMDVLQLVWGYVIPFLILLTVLVFVHEWGHFIVARWCGVKVEAFSIGFGPQLFGYTASSGTRWKVCAIPLGGYVKMYGESQPSSEQRRDAKVKLNNEQLAQSFYAKSVGQRAAIVFAGPFANYLFYIVLIAALFATLGEGFTPTDVGKVTPGSAAERAGIKAGDIIRKIDGKEIERFNDIRQEVVLAPGIPLNITIERGGKMINLTVVPTPVEESDRFGNTQLVGRLGISRTTKDRVIKHYDPFTAVWRAFVKSKDDVTMVFTTVGQIISGRRAVKELGGPVRMAKITGDYWQFGVTTVITIAAFLSLNLGLINLFPIPVLDGGHLLFYAFEAIRGKPLGERAQEYGFKIGIALVLALMVFVTWNDLVQLRVFDFFVNLVT